MPEKDLEQRYVDQRVRIERDAFVRKSAIDSILRREVLLTQLSGSIGRRAAAQDAFTSAAQAAIGLSHPNIVATYDVDSVSGYPLVVQEHVQSESLRTIIDAEKPFHPDDVSILVSNLANALSYARLRGMPHLALTPDRIDVDFDGTVLISDFGIGKVLNDLEQPEPHDTVYLAPELLKSNNGDARSDIYSVAVISYEMLTGSPPEVAFGNRIPTASSLNPEIPPDVSEIVMMALEPRPDDRFRSIEAFAAALEQWRQIDEPILPPTEEHAPQFRHLDPEPTTESSTIPMTTLDDDPILEPGKGRLTTILAWCGLAIGLLALGWVVASFVTDDDNPPPEITRIPNGAALVTSTPPPVAETVPNLVGMTLDQAQTEAGTPIAVSGSRADATAPAGQILEQSPTAGDSIGANGISVVLSSGQNTNALADIDATDTSFEALSAALILRGINVARQDEPSTEIAEGQVIAIVETEAVAGDTVTVRVSMGDRIQIPLELQSQPVDDVQAELEGLGLIVNEPIAVSRDRIEAAGVVLDDFSIINGDVVGIQEDGAGFGQWVPAGSSVTPVYYDAAIE